MLLASVSPFLHRSLPPAMAHISVQPLPIPISAAPRNFSRFNPKSRVPLRNKPEYHDAEKSTTPRKSKSLKAGDLPRCVIHPTAAFPELLLFQIQRSGIRH